jgi:hypothetical protein
VIQAGARSEGRLQGKRRPLRGAPGVPNARAAALSLPLGRPPGRWTFVQRYKDNWKGAARELAAEVANLEDTTEENVRSRLQGHATLTPILRPYRMTLDFGPREKFEDEGLQEVYDAYRDLLFFHVSKFGPGVRASGLDPDFGGKTGGISDERSLGARRAHNLEQSRGKSFVTRKYSEARQYQEAGGDILQLLIPKAQQAKLKVDPDSMFGLYFQNDADFKVIKGIDRFSRDLNWWAYTYLAAEVSPETQHRLPALVAELRRRGSFFQSRPEPTVNIADFVPPTMSEDEALKQAKLLYG